LISRGHDVGLILHLAVGITRGEALLCAWQGPVADPKSAVIAKSEAMINLIGKPVAFVFGRVRRRVNFEIQRFGRPSRSTNLSRSGDDCRHESNKSGAWDFKTAKHGC